MYIRKLFVLLILVATGCQAAVPTPAPTLSPTTAVEAAPSESSVPSATSTEVLATQAEPSPEPVTPTSPPSPTPAALSVTNTAPPPASGEVIIIDHTSVGLFDQIPDEFLEKARNIPLVYSDRSVGANIDTALDCLAASSDWGSIPGHCRRDYTGKDGSTWVWKAFSRNEYLNGQVPERIRFDPDPVKYDRSKWEFDFRGGDWEKMIAEFIQIVVPAHIDSKQSLSFQFNYFSVGPGSDIADDALGFFVDQPHDGYYGGRERWDISDMQALEAQYPDKIIIYWTTSLARAVGTPESQKFNEQMRAYALAHGKVLLDVADIISHDADGNVCYDNRDGVEYCGENGCENYPDDGLDIPAICQDYTTELDGGHLGSVSAGKIMVAKAFWVMMARIAGWDGK